MRKNNANEIENESREDGVFIEWSPLYDTKHKIIDEQHRELVNIINDLYLSTIDNKSNKNDAFIKAAKRCIDYTGFSGFFGFVIFLN